MYQSIPSLTIPASRATPGDSQVLTAPGSGFRQTSFARDFELEKFPTVLKEKCRKFSICFKEIEGSLTSRCSCAVSYQFWQKGKMSTVCLITRTIFGRFGHFDKIFRLSKGHFC